MINYLDTAQKVAVFIGSIGGFVDLILALLRHYRIISYVRFTLELKTAIGEDKQDEYGEPGKTAFPALHACLINRNNYPIHCEETHLLINGKRFDIPEFRIQISSRPSEFVVYKSPHTIEPYRNLRLAVFLRHITPLLPAPRWSRPNIAIRLLVLDEYGHEIKSKPLFIYRWWSWTENYEPFRSAAE